MQSNEGREWVSLGGVGHVELSEGFFGLTYLVHKFGGLRFLSHPGLQRLEE